MKWMLNYSDPVLSFLVFLVSKDSQLCLHCVLCSVYWKVYWKCNAKLLVAANSFSPTSAGSPIRRQCVSPRAMQELHEVCLGAALQQLCALHLLALHFVSSHPSHRRPSLPLPGWLHWRLLRNGDQPVLLQPLSERWRVCSQRGRVHLHLPWRLHWWAKKCVMEGGNVIWDFYVTFICRIYIALHLAAASVSKSF